MRSILDLCKKFWLLIITVLIMSFSVLASDTQSASAIAISPELINSLMLFLYSIPKVGPLLTTILSWIGLIASVFTALSVCATTILKIPQLMAIYSGADDLAKKIDEISKKVKFYLDYLSVFNAKKD